MSDLELTTAVGLKLQVGHPSLAPVSLATHRISFDIDGRSQEYVVMDAGEATERLRVETSSRLDPQPALGGELTIGTFSDTDPVAGHIGTVAVAALEFDDASLSWFATSGDTKEDLEAVTRAKDQLNEVHLERLGTGGIKLTPANLGRTRLSVVHPPASLVEWDRIGLLRIVPLTAKAAESVPKHPGTTVAGGELYEDRMNTGEGYFVLVSDTTVTTIMPPPGIESRGVERDSMNLVVGLAL